MAWLLWARAAHVVGIVCWMGGLLGVAIALSATRRNDAQPVAVAMKRVIAFAVTPGMLLAWVAGLAMLLSAWSSLYASEGWMHAKLTLALLATAATGVATGWVRRRARGDEDAGARAFGWVAVFGAAVTVVVVALVFARP